MIRSLPGRALGIALASWFAVVSTEPAALHTCQMHSAHAGAPAEHATGSAHHAAHGTHSAAAMEAMEATASEAGGDAQPAGGTDAGTHHAACTCLGGCCVASVAAVPPAAPAAAFVVAPRGRLLAEAIVIAPASARYLRPFANGPPVA